MSAPPQVGNPAGPSTKTAASGRLLAVAIGCAISAALITVIEIVWGFIVPEPPTLVWKSARAAVLFQPDSILGYHPPRLAFTVSATKIRANGDTIYNKTYTFDSNGRRRTPPTSSGTSHRFALFVGCSMTFGEGLNDDETLPYFFAQSDTTFHPYNFAFSGYGTEHICELLGDTNIRTEITEPEGILVYPFIDHHISRNIGSMRTYNGWCRRCPYFTLNGDGSVTRDGNFTTGRPVQSFVYRLLGYSNLLRYFKVEIPISISNDHLQLTSALIVESAHRFARMFAASEFWVVFYPGSRYAASLIPSLQANGILTLDYSDADSLVHGEYIIDDADPHPSARANRVLAKRIVEDISSFHRQPTSY